MRIGAAWVMVALLVSACDRPIAPLISGLVEAPSEPGGHIALKPLTLYERVW